jgi:hypothetical protein
MYFIAEDLIFRSKARPQSRLFVKQDKQMKPQPNSAAIREERDISEQQTLPQNSAHYCHVHRISNVTVKPGNYQMTCWKNRSRGS